MAPAAQWREAQAAERSGATDRAVVMYQALLDLEDTARELGDIRANAGLSLAILLMGQGDTAAAAEALRRVIACRTRRPSWRRPLAGRSTI